MPSKPLAELIRERVVVFDGAMGTELYGRHHFVNVCYDELSVSRPDVVKQIHRENKAAGADVLTTNSFGANRYKLAGHLLADRVVEIASAAAEIAREVAGDELYVAGSVGPLGQPIGPGGISANEAIEAFAQPIRGLKEGGADFIIFETFSRRDEMLLAVRAAQREGMDYIACLALGVHGLSRHGETIEEFFAPFPDYLPAPLMIGVNCGVGPSEMLDLLTGFVPCAPFPFLVEPNAGAPRLVSDRMIYLTTPEYLSTYAMHFVQLGARAVGGCCGTGPDHIRVLAQGVKQIHGVHLDLDECTRPEVAPVEPMPLAQKSRFAAKLARGEWVTSVEIVPPLGWDLTATLDKAAACHEAGVDNINIPDGPRASSRISPLITAMEIQNRVGIEAVLHLTCRDRNIIGMQSDLLGAFAAGIRNLLIITGDPPKLGDYPFATAVFDLDSIGFTRVAARLNRGIDVGGWPVRPPTAFLLGVGADPTHLDQEREIDRLAQKAAAGAEYVITQPVFDVEVLLRFLERVKHLKLPILAGLWPLVSLRNAEFLNSEVPGVTVPDALLARMAKAATKEAGRAEGIAIAREIRDAVRPHVAGIQVAAPFGNIQTALAVIAE
jgi:homocysteine S-methyltransferase